MKIFFDFKMVILTIVAVIASQACALEKKQIVHEPDKYGQLKIVESFTLKIPEISGMCWRLNPNTQNKELVIVSDSKHFLYLLDWKNRASKKSLTKVKLKKIFAPKKGVGSQWESVASDKAGRIYILQESPGKIFVLNPELDKIIQEINFNIEESHPIAKDWLDNTNSRGEGIVLLEKGHVLVLKEKKPTLIIEFGPKNEKPIKFNENSFIDEKKEFILQQGKETNFVPLRHWSIKNTDDKIIPDASGLNLGTNGRLFLLSQESKKIIEIEHDFETGKEAINIVKVWNLPSNIETAEGMVLQDNNVPIIGADMKMKDIKKKNKSNGETVYNIFVLSPLNN